VPQAQDTIRVGVVPSMIGVDGTEPIVVELPRSTHPDQVSGLAIELARKQHATENDPARRIGFSVGDKFAGVELPPGSGEAGADILRGIPQVAGMLAALVPQGRGLKAATAIPAIIDAVMQAVTKGPLNVDPMQSATQGAIGAGARMVGKGAEWAGDLGDSKILRSLRLNPSETTDASITMLPKLAKEEGARLTKASEGAIRRKAQQTGAGGLEELADAMGKSRRGEAVAPSRDSGWLNEIVMNFLRRPHRQMAMGQALSNPFGVDMKSKIAPLLEQAIRGSAAQYMGGQPDDEPPMETSRGPRRRGQ